MTRSKRNRQPTGQSAPGGGFYIPRAGAAADDAKGMSRHRSSSCGGGAHHRDSFRTHGKSLTFRATSGARSIIRSGAIMVHEALLVFSPPTCVLPHAGG